MEIDYFDDIRTAEDRIGDRTFISWKHEFMRRPALVIGLVCLVVFLAYTVAKLNQSYLQSFATTRQAMQEKFYPIEGVEEWKVVVTKK